MIDHSRNPSSRVIVFFRAPPMAPPVLARGVPVPLLKNHHDQASKHPNPTTLTVKYGRDPMKRQHPGESRVQ